VGGLDCLVQVLSIKKSKNKLVKLNCTKQAETKNPSLRDLERGLYSIPY